MNLNTSNSEEPDNSRLEDMIHIYAGSKGFRLIDIRGDLRIYHKPGDPGDSASIRITEAVYAMQRSPSEFDKLLSEKFDK